MKMKMFVAAAALLASAMAWGGNAIGGRVTCDGRGIAGVMVTDGYECVTTGNDGRYNMELDGDARFVYVTVPSGYLPRVEKTVPHWPQRQRAGSVSPARRQSAPQAGQRRILAMTKISFSIECL